MLPLLAAIALAPASILVHGGTIVDGSGTPGFVGDLRIQGERIVAVGRLKPRPGEKLVKAQGLVVAPGFLDAHSHADGGAIEHPDAVSQVRQGITTAIVGQDGGWSRPVAEHLARLRAANPSLRFAAFTGHGGLRARAMGDDYKRKATPAEVARMKSLLEADMKAGSLGLSSGLEYDPGYYGDTDELVELAKVAAKYRGRYISHVRDEGNRALDSFRELIEIARRARIPAQISHIKLATFPVWGKAGEVLAMIENARREGLDVTADVYPYRYWQSTITALSTSRDWGNPETWHRALAEVGGPENVLLSNYSHDSAWVGRTIAAIAAAAGRDPADVVGEIVRRTRGPGGSGSESVVVTAMREDDLEAFLRHPMVMFCSDGSIGGSHPRGAGSFPRVLGRFVRERRILSLEEAIRKMTSFPAQRFGLSDRGRLRAGLLADVVLFDPKTVADRATSANPQALSVGIARVFIGGREVSLNPP